MSIKELHLVSDSEVVECKICGKKLTKIDNKHLKCDKTTFEEYKKLYPNEPTITKDKLEKELEAIEKRKVGQKGRKNDTKEVPCLYHPERKVIVNINQANVWLCEECKKEGKVLPFHKKAMETIVKNLKDKLGIVDDSITNISQIPEVKDKKKITFDNHVKEDPEYYKKIVENREKTFIKLFGENWRIVLHELSKKGMLEKYGVESALQVDEFVEKLKKTWKDKTEEEIQEMVDKAKSTKFDRYGDENYNNRDQINITNFLKYDGLSPTCDPEVVKFREEERNKKMFERVKEFLEIGCMKLLDEKYIDAFYNHKFKCLKCGFEFNQSWNSIQQGYTCPNCRPKFEGPSKPELELQEYIKSFNFKNISFANRVLIKPWELDIVIHDIKIAIEYDGFFWHHEKIIEDTRKRLSNPKEYHSMKRQLCLEKGYRLITIFEDEWVFKKDIVLGRLNQILGKASERIHGRKCIIQEIDTSLKNSFLDKYHIQGKDSSIVKLGAFYNNELVSVMTFSKGNISKGSKVKEDVWELNRFCVNYNYHIPGIASKLLDHFKNNYKWVEIFSYADLRWSDGNLYNKLGFSCDNKIRLNYWYIDTNKVKRIHRFQLRKKEEEPKEIPEQILRISEGYKIIWDCGNLKFNLYNSNN